MARTIISGAHFKWTTTTHQMGYKELVLGDLLSSSLLLENDNEYYAASLSTAVTAAVVVVILIILYAIKLKNDLATCQALYNRAEQSRIQERRGRLKLDASYKELQYKKLSSTDADSASSSLPVHPIGTIHSCFSKCVGTPRQGSLAPDTRGYISFNKSISPYSLDGLEEFSHIWIIFVFHQNTNVKAQAEFRSNHQRGQYVFPAKVCPPMLKRRKGIFATRTPHRPNPIGVTLASVRSVQRNKIYISGLDLIDGTPVLDVKPYVPAYDNTTTPVRVATWIDKSVFIQREVVWKNKTIELCDKKLRHYNNDLEGLKNAISQVLSVDIRSIKEERKERAGSGISSLEFDNVTVLYRIINNSSTSSKVEIQSIQ